MDVKRFDFSIQLEETGRRIDELRKQKGYTVKDIQSVMGFEQPQAIYKWLRGKSLPSTDNLLILSRLLGVSINYILVGDEDFSLSGFSRGRRERRLVA